MRLETESASTAIAAAVAGLQGDEAVAGFLNETLGKFDDDTAVASDTIRLLHRFRRKPFARAAAKLLTSEEERTPGRDFVAGLVVNDSAILDYLVDEDNLPLTQATALARNLIAAEPHFDARVLRKIFDESGSDALQVPASTAVRTLQILSDVSDCSRLTPYLIKLLRHPSEHVRSKIVLLLGRGNLNLTRAKQFLASEEPRVRANTVESLWDQSSPGTQSLFLLCAQDSNQRVVVNALVGLCRMGDPKAAARLLNMARSSNPVVRAGAAWGMGHVVHPGTKDQFRAVLETLAGDSAAKVKGMAKRSLQRLDAEAQAASGGASAC